MNVAKVDRDVAMICMLQASVPNVSSVFPDTCCKCVYLDVVYVCNDFKCFSCVCFSSISYICFKYFICLCKSDVASFSSASAAFLLSYAGCASVGPRGRAHLVLPMQSGRSGGASTAVPSLLVSQICRYLGLGQGHENRDPHSI